MLIVCLADNSLEISSRPFRMSSASVTQSALNVNFTKHKVVNCSNAEVCQYTLCKFSFLVIVISVCTFLIQHEERALLHMWARRAQIGLYIHNIFVRPALAWLT